MTLNAVLDTRGPSLAPEIPSPANVRSLSRVLDRQARRLVPVVAGGATAAVIDAGPRVTAIVLATWFLVRLQADRTRLAARRLAVAEVARQWAVPFAAAGVMAAAGIMPDAQLTRALIISSVMTGVLVLVAVVLRSWRAPVRALVVGARDDVAEVLGEWAQRPDASIVGVSLVGSHHAGDGAELDLETFGLPVARGLDGVAETAERLGAGSVVVLPSEAVGPADIRRLAWTLERSGAALALRTPVRGVAPHRLATAEMAGCVVTELGPSRAPAHVRWVKAAVDRLAAAVLLVLLAPVLGVAIAAIRMESPGPGLFTQVRIGRDGRPFRVYKLRTMCTEAEDLKEQLDDADEGHGVLFKIRQDPRITRLGRILRKTSLDELPQLINVVRGEMSLVGPRPALPQEVDQYDDTVRRRLAVRPGMTGLWQVSGRSDLDWDTSVELDLRYTDNLSIAEDLRICLRTVGAVTSGRGAY